jgi:methyl-accepting chemotaxis protein
MYGWAKPASPPVSLLAALMLFVGLGALSLGLTREAGQELDREVGRSLARQQTQVADMLSLFDHTLREQATQFLNLFLAAPELSAGFSLNESRRVSVAGESTSALSNGASLMNNDATLPDQFTARTGAPVTLFARDGQDFVRVTTSLKKADGERAVGTKLNRNSRSYAQIMAGKPYTGIAKLFGTSYITRYQPIRNAAGETIGASFIGIDITEQLALLRDKIRAMTAGDSGYTMLVDAGEKQRGTVLAGGPYEGQSLMDIETAQGEPAFTALFDTASGRTEYTLPDSESGDAITYFTAYPDWNWIIASTVFTDEIRAGIVATRNGAFIAALLLALALAGGLYYIQRRMIGKPLQSLVGMAQRLASGDLPHRVELRRQDEIGKLVTAMNGVGDGLTGLVQDVRQRTGHVENAAQDIAQGSQDLASRSDQAASSLQQTSASLEQITATVANTSQAADEAFKLVHEASDRASQGNSAAQSARQSMQDINASASKIGEIVSLIDSIAFQTNILALNALVEAARAGEHGRGFAVVAQEVRTLASRSADAARDIHGLVEQSTEHTRTGNEHVELAAQRMDEILSAITRVNTTIEEINTGAREQSEGIGQINTAVVELDNMTQQNASMVTQSARAAEAMRAQAKGLVELMARFKLDAADARPAISPPPIVQQPEPARRPAPQKTPSRRQEPGLVDDADGWSTF